MSSIDVSRIGFAGIGIMGAPMVRRLLDQGRSVVVWNRTAEKASDVAAGHDAAEVVSRPADVTKADVVILMLLDTAACERVLLAPDGLLQADRLPKVVVNMSTIDPLSSARLREACVGRGCDYVAAPVSGSTLFAREGMLTIIASGTSDAFESVRPILEDLGKRVLHVGEHVEGNLLKLAVTMVIGAYSSAMYEAMALCRKGGVDEATYLSILNESVIGTAYSRYKTPALIAHDYAPAHSVSGLAKDYDLMDLTAQWLNTPIPITAIVRQQLRAAVGRGDGALDMTALLDQYLRDAGLAGHEAQERR